MIVLRRQGVAATRIRTQSNLFRSGGKVTAEDIAIFSRQLATMMAAGIPLVQSFEIIGNGHEKPAMQKLILDIKANIEGGERFDWFYDDSDNDGFGIGQNIACSHAHDVHSISSASRDRNRRGLVRPGDVLGGAGGRFRRGWAFRRFANGRRRCCR